MDNTWRPWENHSDNHGGNEENNVAQGNNNGESVCVRPNIEGGRKIVQGKSSFKNRLDKRVQEIVCSVYDYIKKTHVGKRGAIVETAKAVKLSRQTVSKIINRGPKTPQKPGNKKQKFEKVDKFTCDVVRRELYRFYEKGQSPTLNDLLIKLQTVCEFPYQSEWLRQILINLGFRFRKLDKRRVIMESNRIVAWRYQYLNRLNYLRQEGYLIIFLDETWYDTHDVVSKGWDDGSCSCCLQAPVSRGKRIMILHAGSTEGWVNGCLYLTSKDIRDSMADSHNEMNSTIFEEWFQNTLLQNLPPKKCVIVLDNASYHSRLKVKTPTRKHEMIEFMKAHNIPVPDPVPINAVLSQIIKRANIRKQHVIEEMARARGHEVLRLPPYHCCLNPIELVWARLKHRVKKENVTPSSTVSVCRVLRKCVDDIGRDLWEKCVQHTISIETRYMSQDVAIDNGQVIINVDSSDSDSTTEDN